MSGPRIGELFAGYGGLGMGVQAALGGEMAWYSEIDKGALKILDHRFPDVPNVGDITTVDWSQVEPVDILTGGSPCQDLSHAGKRAGMTEGTRSNLWVAMREAIAQLRPGLVVWENVRGAASASATSDLEPCAGCVGDGPGVHLRALGRVVGDLAELGYVGGWHGLRAGDIGAPHGRFRFFLIAYPASNAGWFQHGDGGAVADAQGGGKQDGTRRDDQGWALVRTGAGTGGRDDAGRSTAGVPIVGRGAGSLLPTPTSSDTNGAGVHGDGGLDLRTAVTVLPTPTTRDYKDHTIRREPHRPDDVDTLARALTVTLLPTPRAGDGEKGQRTPAGSQRELDRGRNIDLGMVNALQWGQYAAAIARWEQITRPAPPPTETGPKGNPRLSAAFSEWLMGLPAGWVTDVPGITRNEALRALGNGVVPQQAEAAVRFLLAHLTNEVAA